MAVTGWCKLAPHTKASQHPAAEPSQLRPHTVSPGPLLSSANRSGRSRTHTGGCLKPLSFGVSCYLLQLIGRCRKPGDHTPGGRGAVFNFRESILVLLSRHWKIFLSSRHVVWPSAHAGSWLPHGEGLRGPCKGHKLPSWDVVCPGIYFVP